MRINSKQLLFGQPILKIREVLRHAMTERLNCIKKEIVINEVARLLSQPTSIAKKVFESMIDEGYLAIKKEKVGNRFYLIVEETEKGRRLGVTRANPPISREKADTLLKELLGRAEAVNKNKELVYFVDSVKVFGSYLSKQQRLGDIDVAIKLTRKATGDEFLKRNQERIKIAFQNERRFPNYVEQICWPHREVMLLLNTRKKGLSLHDEESDGIVKKTKCKTVYKYAGKVYKK